MLTACTGTVAGTSCVESNVPVGTGRNVDHRQDRAISFTVRSADSSSGVETTAKAGTAAVGTWYHLVGISDNAAHTITLYVNGVQTATAAYSSAWKAAGHTTIGRAKYGGAPVDFVTGAIDDVRMESTAVYPSPIAAVDAYSVNEGSALNVSAPGLLTNDAARRDPRGGSRSARPSTRSGQDFSAPTCRARRGRAGLVPLIRNSPSRAGR